MRRFTNQKNKKISKTLLGSLCLFLLVIALFSGGISSLSESTRARQKESLENALARDIAYCYTMEGAYPENLDYIKENYGLTYDENRFYIDYKVIGSNVFPDVTIIDKED